jgi:hypothetical protein
VIIKAVPQVYRGVRFRSTLEADWAATLDTLKIQWQYEPEAVRLPSGTFYRPDFYLPELTTWLEVKGPHDERLDKTRELAKATMYDPRWTEHLATLPEVTFRSRGEIDEQQLSELIDECPDGTTIVTVERRHILPIDLNGSLWDAGNWRSVDLGTARLKRRIRISPELAEARAETGIEQWGGGWSCPWRLTVLGRAAIAGQTTFEDVTGGYDLSLIRCSSCNQHSFFEEVGLWVCRACQANGKVYAGGRWHSGDLRFARAPRRTTT